MHILTPTNVKARQWMLDNVNFEAWQEVFPGIALEGKYLVDICQGAIDAGFTAEDFEVS